MGSAMTEPMRSAELLYKGRRRSVAFYGPLPEGEAAEWRTWFERHGIDPDHVAIPGAAVADDERRVVEYQAVHGWAVNDPGTFFAPVRVQLEARALPFPPMPDR